jgi:pimeloyl-ACP methyl ester carboxylesterase
LFDRRESAAGIIQEAAYLTMKSARERTSALPHKRSRLWRWTKRVLAGLAGLVVVLLLAGAAYQFIATKIDERKYPPPGRLFDVGGYRLHLYCVGEGTPTVVLDAGLGGGVLDWGTVQPEVSKFARVCAYDRAGMAWSESGFRPRTSRQVVTELHALLGNAGVRAPYVLIGHSIAGIHVQLYAGQYPDEVAGLVLVDSSHEDQLTRKGMTQIPSFYPPLVKAVSPFGVIRLMDLVGTPSPNIPPDVNAERAAVYSHTRNMYSYADEMSAIPVSMEQLRAAPMRLGDKPLIVLTHGLKEANQAGSPEEAEQGEQAWSELQAELARRSSSGKQIVAEKSGHYIQFDQPDLVIDAIRQVVESTRRR